MPLFDPLLSRRDFLAALAALAMTSSASTRSAFAAAGPMLAKSIPATGERMPVIGMGSWLTFDVGKDPRLRDDRVQVLKAFFEMGGGMIDSSPMYRSSQEVIGYCLAHMAERQTPFSATKVWTRGRSNGVAQMEESRRLWGVERFDLMQIHSLLGWEGHLETLLTQKSEGSLRYTGVTTSHGRRHDDFEQIMGGQPGMTRGLPL